MCVIAYDAEVPQTYVGVWDIDHPQWGYRHVMAYQNTPQNFSNEANCMLLHIPSATPITPEYILDTSACPQLLHQIFSSALSCRAGIGANYTMEMGIYHIAILNEVKKSAVEKALQSVPKEKRPNIPFAFIDFFATTFPNYPLILCCFNNREAREATPIMVHYEPLHPEVFQLNTLEAHGEIPIIGERIQFDQKIVVGSCRIKEASEESHPIDLRRAPEELRPYLPSFGFADELHYELPNGDILLSVDDVANSRETRPVFNILPQFEGF